MNYSPDELYVYEDGGETILEIPDPGAYRNARPRPRPRPVDARGRRRRDYRSAMPARASRRVVIRRPEGEDMRGEPVTPVIVEQPVIEQPPAYGVSIGGMQLSFGTIAGTLLTLGGIGVQVASHFVSMPAPPTGEQEDVIDDLVQYNQVKQQADRKLRLLGSIGRALSDVGQLAALRQ